MSIHLQALEARVVSHYLTPGSAERYRDRWGSRRGKRLNDWWERRLVDGLLARVPGGRVDGPALDVPSGFGRLYDLVRRRASAVVEADLSAEMLADARAVQSARPAAGYVRASAVDLPFADRAFALVVSVRLSHHLHDPTKRARHLRELFRVSRGWVLFTFSDAESAKQRRDLRRAPGGKARRRATLRRAEVAEIARGEGFELVRVAALVPFFSLQRFALARRVE